MRTNSRSLKNLIGCCVLVLVLLLPGLCFAKAVVLKGMTVFEPSRNNVIQLTWLADKVKEKSGGDLQIRILGGPDIIPIPEQPQSLMDGSIDILLTFPTTFEDKVPQTIPMATSQKTPMEERDNGFFDYLNAQCEKVNMRFICRSESESGTLFFGNKKVRTLEDFKGQMVGLSPMWIAFMKKLGAVPVVIDEPNIYTALSRGTVDAHTSPSEAQVSLGLYEVTKYVIGPRFYAASNMMIVMNLDSWNKLSPEHQAILLEAGKEVEREMTVWFHEFQEDNINKLTTEYKMERIELSPEDSQKYIDLANEAMWDKTKEKNTPEDFEALQKFLK